MEATPGGIEQHCGWVAWTVSHGDCADEATVITSEKYMRVKFVCLVSFRKDFQEK